ncbi:MAG: 2-isopropylmalate synthase, partial [Dechloromonas sp.]
LDIVNVALNMYIQGVSPGLDFSNIDAIRATVEYCNQLPVHPRHPYVGDLVYTSFSGSHQDAIKKAFAARKEGDIWDMPYLPIDPKDLGRSYDSVIRVNSQSGKGGIAYLMETEHGVVMPRRLQVEFSGVVQKHTDTHGGEVSADDIWNLFAGSYLDIASPIRYREHHLFEHGEAQGIRLAVDIDGQPCVLTGEGNGPINAAVHAMQTAGFNFSVRSYEERSMVPMGEDGNARACAMVEVATKGGGDLYGIGIDSNIVTASIKALISGVNRLGAASRVAQAA